MKNCRVCALSAKLSTDTRSLPMTKVRLHRDDHGDNHFFFFLIIFKIDLLRTFSYTSCFENLHSKRTTRTSLYCTPPPPFFFIHLSQTLCTHKKKKPDLFKLPGRPHVFYLGMDFSRTNHWCVQPV